MDAVSLSKPASLALVAACWACAPPLPASADVETPARPVPVRVDRVADRFFPAMVSITFDDAGVGQDLAAADLEDRDMRGTFYFTSSFIDMDAIHMTHAQAQRVVDGGHEIGDHTITHPILTQLDSQGVEHEIDDARTDLENMFPGVSIHNFAPPFGDTDVEVTSVAEQSFDSQRTVIRGYNQPSTDVFRLKSNAINSGAGDWTPIPPAWVHDHLEAAIDAGGWFIVHFHMIVEDEPQLHIEYPRASMDQIFDDFAKERDQKRISVVTIAEALSYLRLSPQPAPAKPSATIHKVHEVN
jgi:peptidoglycan/xylan/chitin deacetylase (PgdA/CDA1 family)